MQAAMPIRSQANRSARFAASRIRGIDVPSTFTCTIIVAKDTADLPISSGNSRTLAADPISVRNCPTCAGSSSSQLEPHEIYRRVIRVVDDLKSELPAHVQHRGVFLQHLAFDASEILAARIADDQLHEPPPDAAALEIGAHQDGVFGGFVVG